MFETLLRMHITQENLGKRIALLEEASRAATEILNSLVDEINKINKAMFDTTAERLAMSKVIERVAQDCRWNENHWKEPAPKDEAPVETVGTDTHSFDGNIGAMESLHKTVRKVYDLLANEDIPVSEAVYILQIVQIELIEQGYSPQFREWKKKRQEIIDAHWNGHSNRHSSKDAQGGAKTMPVLEPAVDPS